MSNTPDNMHGIVYIDPRQLDDFSIEVSGFPLYYSQSKVDELLEANKRLSKGIIAVRALMNESYGVDGLHLNGDIAAWDELEQGGRFEEWLIDFNEAEEYAKIGDSDD